MNAMVFIISHLRPENVSRMQELVGTPVCWVVGKGEAQAYRDAGAYLVIEGGGLCESRNAALREAFRNGVPCVQLSDDLSKIQYTGDGKEVADITFTEAVGKIERAMEQRPEYRLAGVAPTPNAFYFHRPYSSDAFILGDFIYVKPSEPIFDEKLKLKEDYDFTAQHLKMYGGALRANGILCTFAHRKNKGGAVATRTTELEQASILRLMQKHPGYFRENPRRPNEVLMKAPSN